MAGPQVDRVEWALAHDSKARAIAQRGRAFAASRLGLGRVGCYWAALLDRYARLQAFRPEPDPHATRMVGLALEDW